MSKLDFGCVEVELDETLTLQPTLRAFEKIERKFGGLASAIQPLGTFNLEAIAFVISAGANLGQKRDEDLKKQIFERGVSKVAPLAIKYITLLMNPTGKDDEELEAMKGEDGGK